MSLATRCPHCKTVFQVSEAQLKLRSGTVRCGVCQNPFNGIDNLVGRVFSPQTDTLPKTRETPETPVPDNVPALAAHDSVFLTDQNGLCPVSLEQTDDPASTGEEDSSDEAVCHSLPDEALKEAFDKQLQALSLELDELPADDKLVEIRDISPSPQTGLNDSAAKEEPTKPAEKVQPTPPLPLPCEGTDRLPLPDSSHNAAEELTALLQKKRKKSRISLILWSFGVIFLAVILYGQLVYRYAEQIVSWWPPAQPLVESTCEILSCPAQDYPVSNPLNLEYGNLLAYEETTNRFIQPITLVNNSPSLQWWPSLVLEITDASNNVLSRKILEPQEYLPEEYGVTPGLAPSEHRAFELAIEFQHDSAINSRITILNH